MPCTTIIVGRKATNDGSTIIARNDDGGYTTKKLIVVEPDKQPKVYKSKISHCVIELKEKPMRYTCIPNVSKDEGIWGAAGINEANVGMSATETINANSLVFGADPYVEYEPKKGNKPEKAGGLGEEDFVTLVLPYIKSAREGVIRLGKLLEKYGTYESNGIAFNDDKECWYMETIGGHHYMAVRCKDDEVIIMPNQLGIDNFDLDDALGKQKENICSKDLKEFIEKNHLNCCQKGFNPRDIFGTHNDGDHVYNTPRGWFMGKLLCPSKYKWEGDNADFTPISDNIPFSLKPERKITIEEVKYILSTVYQGTKYNPYQKADYPEKGIYRVIGISRTDDLAILQIRPNMPKEIKSIEWVSFASNPFNASYAYYPSGKEVPAYLSKVEEKVDTHNLFWSSRLLAVMADAHYGDSLMHIERYQKAVFNKSHEIINKYDALFVKKKDIKLIDEANKQLATMLEEETNKALFNVLKVASEHMKNRFNRTDN